jgi:ribokinase
MAGSHGNIVVIGSSNTDMVVQARSIPRPGETVLGGEFTMAAGGKGANQAVAAARAGGKVTLIAKIGDDVFGRRAMEGFRKEGIDVRFVAQATGIASGVALIMVDERGENSIAVAPGANARLTPADVEAAGDAIAGADCVVMQLETPMETVEAAARMAAEAGVRVILDPAPIQPLSDELLRCVAILTPNETEAGLPSGIDVTNRAAAEMAGRMLQERGAAAVIVTLGAQGSLVLAGESAEHIPAFRAKAVDTTAAGDVFNGSLAVRLSEGASLQDAVQFASAASAISVTRLGAQPSAPTRNQIDEFLAKHAS